VPGIEPGPLDILIGLITGCLVNVVAVMGDVFILVYNLNVPLALKVG
jgi:hypothetical protein